MSDDHGSRVPPGTPALVVTVSDGVAAGIRQDDAGAALADRLGALGFGVDRAAVPDERPAIEAALRDGTTDHVLVVSTGGTGWGRRTRRPILTTSSMPAPRG